MSNRKIVHQVTFKHMKMNTRRTVISVIGIALMVMLLTVVFVGKDTAIRYFVDLAGAHSGKYHYAVYNINREKLEQIKGIEGVTETGVTEDLKYTEFEQTGNKLRPFLNIRRYSSQAIDWMNIKVAEGRLPENGNEIVISIDALDEGSSVKIGDTIKASTFRRFWTNHADSGFFVVNVPLFVVEAGQTCELPYNMGYIEFGKDGDDSFDSNMEEIREYTGFEQEYTVVGFIEQPSFENKGCAWYTAMSLVDEDTINNDTFNALLMTDTKKTPGDFELMLRDIAGDTNYDFNNTLLIFLGTSDDDSMNTIVNLALCFFLVLITLISVMLIYNVFALSYDERVRYLGMLASVGATGKQKRSSVYFEAFSMLLPAIPVGFLAGLGVAKVAAHFVAPIAQRIFVFDSAGVTDLEPVLVVKPASVIGIIVMSAVTVFISALIPARKIGKVGPIESIRGTGKKNGKHRKNSNPDKLIGTSPARMLSARFLKNDRSKSMGIIRAVAIFLLVTVVVNFTSSVLMQMLDFKLQDNHIYLKYYNSRQYVVNFYPSRRPDIDTEAVIEGIKDTEGVSDVEICKYSGTSLRVEDEELSDEYFDDVYEILSMFYEPGEYTREMFDEEQSRSEAGTYVGVYALDDKTFAELSGKVNAVSYEEGELPCILVNAAAVTTDEFIISGHKPSNYKYLEISDPFAAKTGEYIHTKPSSITRAEAIEYGYDIDEMAFPELELEGTLDLKVISKAGSNELDDYFIGTGNFQLQMIVPMSVAEYIDKVNCSPMNTDVFFNCDNEDSMKILSALTDQMNAEGTNIHMASTDARSYDFRQVIGFLLKTVLIVFTILASAICLLNVYSSVSALMTSRRKHFAILKSMGSTFRQIVAAELREGIGMLIRSVLAAAPVIALICFGFAKVLIRRFGYFTVTFPWGFTLILVLLITCALMIMTVTCLRRENKIDIINEIKRESV